MENALSVNNTQQIITLNDIIPCVQKLSSVDKLRLIRILAGELDKNEYLFPFEPDKIYHLHTPYNTFGVAEILMNTLEKHQIGNRLISQSSGCLLSLTPLILDKHNKTLTPLASGKGG